MHRATAVLLVSLALGACGCKMGAASRQKLWNCTFGAVSNVRVGFGRNEKKDECEEESDPKFAAWRTMRKLHEKDNADMKKIREEGIGPDGGLRRKY